MKDQSFDLLASGLVIIATSFFLLANIN